MYAQNDSTSSSDRFFVFFFLEFDSGVMPHHHLTPPYGQAGVVEILRYW